MSEVILWILSITTFLIGYYLGGKGKVIADEIQEEIKEKLRDKPKPGVVNKLTDEQLQEKQDPKKKGNLEAFNRFFKEHPLIK